MVMMTETKVKERAERALDATRNPHYRSALVKYLRRGIWGIMDLPDREKRALAAGRDPTAGGYLVPEEFAEKLWQAERDTSSVRSVATVILTERGGEWALPTVDDSGSLGAAPAEGDAMPEGDPSFGQRVMRSFPYATLVRVSIQAIQDVDLESALPMLMGRRIGARLNQDLTTGSTPDRPQGVATAATVGRTGATGQVSSVTYADLTALMQAVHPVHRFTPEGAPRARWMLASGTLQAVQEILDGSGRPVWVPDPTGQSGGSILGFPYTVNNDMPAMAASVRSILFGNFKECVVRDVGGMRVLRLTERYAGNMQVGFVVFARHDGLLVDPARNAIMVYQNAAA